MDIFEQMRKRIGCDYISCLPTKKDAVRKELAALPPDVHADRLTAIAAESAAANILFFIFTSPLYLYFLFSRLCKTAGRTLLPA